VLLLPPRVLLRYDRDQGDGDCCFDARNELILFLAPSLY
jgi:hypothetical protein